MKGMIAQLPILYSFRRCPYAMRARLALHASGQPYVLREVVLKDKPADMLELSPKGTVPVLHLPDRYVIDESLDIMLWALGNADPEGWLDDFDTDLLAACDGDFKGHLDRYKYATRYPDADPLAHRAAGEVFIAGLETRLRRGAHLMGLRFSIMDAAILPFVRQFALADWDWFFATPYPNVQRWLDAFIASPRFQAVMAKHPQWQAGDDGVLMRAS